MRKRSPTTNPRNYFLNESHELATLEKSGGGRAPQYVGISWAAKSQKVSASLEATTSKIRSSHDPLREERFFVIANPVDHVEKRSSDKRKAPDGKFKEATEFGGQHSRVFERIGLDLLQVTEDGKAVVHAPSERMDQLMHRAATLGELGPRERARWVTIDSFDTIPVQIRADGDWLSQLSPNRTNPVVIELQPVLTRIEADTVLRAIADLLAEHDGGRLVGNGTDFSGRHWFRGQASRQVIRKIARDFYSVQSVHAPLLSIAAAKSSHSRKARAPSSSISSWHPSDSIDLPCVAVLDFGVASDHRQLRRFRRGQFVPTDAPAPPIGDHGALVASRVVFGEHETPESLETATGQCSFYDAIVADYPGGTSANNKVNDKIVMEALRGVHGAAPDVRVFNLSIGDHRPLAELPVVERHEKRLLLQDLDNFIFATDSLVVVAAGNSRPGVLPNAKYPVHFTDKNWALGPWACGFNTLVCGSYVPRVSANGLGQRHWPSPFSRVGPGICDAPVPSFGAPGGNTNSQFRQALGLGVWGFSGAGMVEDRSGTSYAAPLLAREAAMAIRELDRVCVSGTRPFAVTARAFLTLVARRPTDDSRVQQLVELTLGNGYANAARLRIPTAKSAVLVWQGHIESPNDVIRIQLPIPRDWLNEAESPTLRLVVCADPPVNETAHSTWACRKVVPVLHPGPDVRALNAPRGGHDSFPIIDRTYRLTKYKPGHEKGVDGDMWLLEISYKEIAPYPPAMDFDPRQRVAFAAEIFDASATQADPQPAMQALPIATSMTRLSIQPAAIRNPVIVRTR